MSYTRLRSAGLNSVPGSWKYDVKNSTRPARSDMRQKLGTPSTATMRSMSSMPHLSPEPSFTSPPYASSSEGDFDVEGSVYGNPPKHFVVGTDFGTTFTSVAYFTSTARLHHGARVSEIKTIKNWPNDPSNGLAEQVPTELWYSSVPLIRPPVEDQFDDPANETESGNLHVGLAPGPSQSKNIEDGIDNQGDAEMDDDHSTELLWGYAVPYQMYNANTNRNPNRRFDRAKLLLVNTPYTKHERTTLRKRLNRLIKMGIVRKYGKQSVPDVRDVRDVITDFLIKVFEHTKAELSKHEGYNDQSTIEFVFTVPTIWSPESSRVLQASMEAAILVSGFGTLENGSVNNLFLIPEPEAAATYLIGTTQALSIGEVVTFIDGGGGTVWNNSFISRLVSIAEAPKLFPETYKLKLFVHITNFPFFQVDAVTYSIDTRYPLRLGQEVVLPDGDNCGASYLNENYRERLLWRLRGETYLERTGEALNSIVNFLIPDFELMDKRRKDITKRPTGRVRIPGLLGDKRTGVKNKFDDNILLLDSEDYEQIFVPLLKRVGAVLRNQLEASFAKGEIVKKVFLIGGFGAAPSLRSYLRHFLDAMLKEFNLKYEINLIEDSRKSVTAVACGAVLRALNKDNGPQRLANSSYGFLRVEPYQREVFPAHKFAKPIPDPVDGEKYVHVINYFMIKASLVPPIHTYGPFKTYHTFAVHKRQLLCEELLYVSDQAVESHYTLSSPKNRGTQLVGRIVLDMTQLRDDGKLELVYPFPDQHGTLRGVMHYKVEYDLFAIVEGRNLRYEARYPCGPGGVVKQAGQVSIAAAFKPGTG